MSRNAGTILNPRDVMKSIKRKVHEDHKLN